MEKENLELFCFLFTFSIRVLWNFFLRFGFAICMSEVRRIWSEEHGFSWLLWHCFSAVRTGSLNQIQQGSFFNLERTVHFLTFSTLKKPLKGSTSRIAWESTLHLGLSVNQVCLHLLQKLCCFTQLFSQPVVGQGHPSFLLEMTSCQRIDLQTSDRGLDRFRKECGRRKRYDNRNIFYLCV